MFKKYPGRKLIFRGIFVDIYTRSKICFNNQGKIIKMDQFLKEYRPQRPWASNDLAGSGVRREMRSSALEMRYIEPNVKSVRNLITVDVDVDNAAWDLKSKIFDDHILPIPSFITTNPQSTHAHVGWFIEGVAASEKQIYVFEKLRKKMTVLAGGDPAYSGSIFRNPLHTGMATEYFESDLLSFQELANYTKGIEVTARPKGAMVEAEGRNVTLFEAGRDWAYSAYYKALKTASVPFFRSALEGFLVAENAEFSRPLPKSEVISIARSIESFVSKKFNLTKFEEKQAAQREKSIAVRKANANAKYLAIKEIMQTGASMKLACDTLGFNYSSVRASWKKWEGA